LLFEVRACVACSSLAQEKSDRAGVSEVSLGPWVVMLTSHSRSRTKPSSAAWLARSTAPHRPPMHSLWPRESEEPCQLFVASCHRVTLSDCRASPGRWFLGRAHIEHWLCRMLPRSVDAACCVCVDSCGRVWGCQGRPGHTAHLVTHAKVCVN
jgi:hypothetical protein